MFMLTRTKRKNCTIKKRSQYWLMLYKRHFSSGPLPIQGLLFFFPFLNNMFNYIGTLYRSRNTYTRKITRIEENKKTSHYIATGYNKNTLPLKRLIDFTGTSYIGTGHVFTKSNQKIREKKYKTVHYSGTGYYKNTVQIDINNNYQGFSYSKSIDFQLLNRVIRSK